VSDLSNLDNRSTVAGCCTTGSCGHADGAGEIERLRAAGDALAFDLRRHLMACGVKDARQSLVTWDEARK